jgi:hypothetical protein
MVARIHLLYVNFSSLTSQSVGEPPGSFNVPIGDRHPAHTFRRG